MPITLDDLTISFRNLDRNSLLDDWRWLVGYTRVPILITAIGDAFLQDSVDGRVYLLATGAASIQCVAISTDEFTELLQQPSFVVEHLAPGLIAHLRGIGRRLSPGQLYGFKVPPHLGGEYTAENLEPTDVSVHFSLLGQLHKQTQALKPGTKITSVKIE